jgi:mono/diheme cytochrome c family protein
MQVNSGTHIKPKTAVAAATFAAIIVAAAAFAQDGAARVTGENATHVAMLSGAAEVPPVETAGTGTAYILYDAATARITWTVDYTGLTGPATGAHIHGPATPAETAGVLINLQGGEESEGRLQGEADITPEQAAQLAEGLLYVNIHTEANRGGEIRGQLLAADAAAAAADAGPDAALFAALMEEGATVYRSRCAGCHGRNGEGQPPAQDAAPALAGASALGSVRTIAVQVLRGGAYMPPFDTLTDRQIAAVATYIRNSFGNSRGIATEQEIAGYR